jgi:hypothetical protein
MTLSHIIGTPVLVSQRSFIIGTPYTDLAALGPFDISQNFVDLIVQNFRYWSGSYKFKAYITASLFHIVRGVFWLGEVSPAVTNWQNCYHKVVDIQGDTEVEFMVPYCHQDFAAQTSTGAQYSIFFQVLSWSQPDPAVSSPITINMYKAGDSDFQVSVLKEMFFTPQSNPRRDFVKSFEPMHESMVGYEHDGLLFGEQYETLREILHRSHALTQISSSAHSVAVYNPTSYGPEKWGQLFRFWRGSVRFKLMLTDGSNPSRVVYLQDGGNSNLGYTISSRNNPLMEFEAPYYSNLLFNSTDAVSPQTANWSAVTVFLTKSMGDDFSYHFLRLPSTDLSDGSPSANFGQNALRLFFG